MWDLCSLTRDQTHIFCIGRRIPNHWITRKVPDLVIFISVSPFIPNHLFHLLQGTYIILAPLSKWVPSNPIFTWIKRTILPNSQLAISPSLTDFFDHQERYSSMHWHQCTSQTCCEQSEPSLATERASAMCLLSLQIPLTQHLPSTMRPQMSFLWNK